MATTTVLALFKDKRDAEAAVRALQSAHFDKAELRVTPPRQAHVPAFGKIAVAGMAIGGIACGLVGTLIGVVVGGFPPGSHSWLILFAITGAATGILAGLLVSQSVPRQRALYYEEEVEAGRTLVSVTSDVERAATARCILLDEGAFEASPIDAPTEKAS